MDPLRTAVVDITTLVAACRALSRRQGRADDDPDLPPRLCGRLRRDIRRATLAYIDTLARNKRGRGDEDPLLRCRLAAERQMPSALGHQAALRRLMAAREGVLDGLPAMRQDLWRLAHVAIQLHLGLRALRETDVTKVATALAARLRRRLRRALVAYARATLRPSGRHQRPIDGARAAALDKIGRRGGAVAERLAEVDPDRAALWLAANRSLGDLELDWRSAQATMT